MVLTAKSKGKSIKFSCTGTDEIIDVQNVTRGGVPDAEAAEDEFRGDVQQQCFRQAFQAVKKGNGKKVTSYKCRNLRCIEKSEAKCLGLYEQFGPLELLLLIMITVSPTFLSPFLSSLSLFYCYYQGHCSNSEPPA